jgi:myosin heavy subunit
MNITKGRLILLVAVPFTIALAWGIITTIRLSGVEKTLQQNLVTLSQTQNELGDTKQQLADVQTELTTTQDAFTQTKSILAETQTQLSTAQAELSSTQAQLLSTSNQLSAANSQLASTQTQLAAAQTQLTSTQTQLTSTQSQLSDTQSQLASSMQQLTDYKKTMQALGITVHSSNTAWTFNGLQWIHNDNSQAANPTWNQLLAFITQDKTDQNPYNLQTFNCVNYSTTVYNNAEKLNIEAAMVTLNLKSSQIGHAINAFITSDYGLVYVDCTGTDTIARVEAGKIYRAVPSGSILPANVRNDSWWDALTGNYYYLMNDYRGQAVVDTIDIYW